MGCALQDTECWDELGEDASPAVASAALIAELKNLGELEVR